MHLETQVGPRQLDTPRHTEMITFLQLTPVEPQWFGLNPCLPLTFSKPSTCTFSHPPLLLSLQWHSYQLSSRLLGHEFTLPVLFLAPGWPPLYPFLTLPQNMLSKIHIWPCLFVLRSLLVAALPLAPLLSPTLSLDGPNCSLHLLHPHFPDWLKQLAWP